MPRLSALLLLACFRLMAHAQSWQSMADVPIDLAFPVVVELNGDIHVLGGGAPNGAAHEHLRYKPATNAWDTLAGMPYLAQQPCGAVVDGKIHYCGGGYPNTGTPLASHYVYDPGTDSWSQAASLPFPTAINESVSLDGKLYVLSGQPNKQLCESYDPNTDAWTAHNALPDLNFWYGAVQTANGTIYRFGGGGYVAPTSAAHVYDPGNDSWSPLPSLPMAVHAVAGANIGDSLICLAGGYSNATDLNNVWLYHINSQQYETMDPLPVARSYHALVRVGECVYSVGGNNPNDPSVGTSLLRNCSIGTRVRPVAPGTARPYTAQLTSSLAQFQFDPSAHGILIEVQDAAGRMVEQRRVPDGRATLSGEGRPTGTYTISLMIEDRRYSERWVIAH